MKSVLNQLYFQLPICFLLQSILSPQQFQFFKILFISERAGSFNKLDEVQVCTLSMDSFNDIGTLHIMVYDYLQKSLLLCNNLILLVPHLDQ